MKIKTNQLSLRLLAPFAGLLLVTQAQAAVIAWAAPSPVADASSILNNGAAVDANTINRAGATQTVNGVLFASGGGATTTYWTGSGGASTGDTGLDQMLNTHNNAGGTTPLVITLSGLNPLDDYQFQFIVAHDTRGCCSGRTYSIGDGAGGDSGFDLARGAGGNGTTGSLLGTMVGTFTADSATQTLQIGGFAGDGVDAAVSGYALRNVTVPEPSSALLGLLGGALILRRRR